MSLELAKNAAGDYAIGSTIDGVFVPFASVPAVRLKHYSERAESLAAKAGDPAHEGHGPALDAIESDWQVVKGKPSGTKEA